MSIISVDLEVVRPLIVLLLQTFIYGNTMVSDMINFTFPIKLWANQRKAQLILIILFEEKLKVLGGDLENLVVMVQPNIWCSFL